MTEKNLIIGVIIILVLGAAVFGGYTKFKENFIASPSPSPSASDILLPEKESTQSGQPFDSAQGKKTMKQYQKAPPVLPADQLTNRKAVIQTAKGKIEFELYPEASMAASNFIFLTNDGFYNGLSFHRVEPGFVIQGGDPLGNGRGGPGYQVEDEPVIKKYTKGTVAMANAGPNTNGSQFFIMLEDNPSLPPKYTIFGKVISGQDVVSQIKVGDMMQKVTIESLK